MVTGTQETIAAVILAAGDSARMGYPKALLPIGAETFLSRIVRTLHAAGFSSISVVVGRHAEEIRRRTNHPGLSFLINENPDLGQISSIQLALGYLSPDHSAALIWPVDQPAVSETLVRGLVRIYLESDAMIVVPTHRGQPGHPVIFRRDLCRLLLDLPPGSNPKQLIRHHMQLGAFLPTDEAGVTMDADTPEEYSLLVGETLEDALLRVRRGGSQ